MSLFLRFARLQIAIVPYPNQLEPGREPCREEPVRHLRQPRRRTDAARRGWIRRTAGGGFRRGESRDGRRDEMPASGIRFVVDGSLPPKGKLNVTKGGLEVQASQFSSFLYALQSLNSFCLRRLCEPARCGVEGALREDRRRPRFAYRSMHLDVARHFFSVERSKQYLDVWRSY